MEGDDQLGEKHPEMTRGDLLQAFKLNRMKQMKLERLTRYNIRLKEELKQDRIKTSNCALMVIDYTEKHEDKLLPEIWGDTPNNRYRPTQGKKSNLGYNNNNNNNNTTTNNNNVADGSNGGCCTIM